MNAVVTHNSYLEMNRGKFNSRRYELLQAGISLHITSRFHKNFTDRPHFHENAHFCLIVSGGVLDKRTGSEVVRNSGELMFFRAGEPHQTNHLSFEVRNISLEIEDRFLDRYGIGENSLAASAIAPQTKFSILKICNEIAIADRFSGSSIDLLAAGLSEMVPERRTPQWMRTVEELLRDRWDEDIPVSEIAEAAGVHVKTVSKHFTRYFGCTLGEFRRRIRIEKAIALIGATPEPLTGIALRCGFFDQSHFTRVFREQTGIRPKDLRKF